MSRSVKQWIIRASMDTYRVHGNFPSRTDLPYPGGKWKALDHHISRYILGLMLFVVAFESLPDLY